MEDLDITAAAMVREWPIRSAVTIVVPLLFAAGQLAISYYHGVSLVYSAAFATLFVGIVVLTIQQQWAAFRAARLRSTYADKTY